MRVGIDVRALSHELTGIGRYTLNIIEYLLEDISEVQWFFYSDRPLLVELKPKNNVTLRVGGASKRFSSTIYSQCVFPYWAYQDRLDVFWSPRHHLPIILGASKRIKKVVTIHDLVWRRHPETMSKMGVLLERLLFFPSIRIADKILSVSKFTESELVKFFPDESHKITTVSLQSFIKPNNGFVKMQRTIPDDYILFVGTLEPRKNLANLLQAYYLLDKKGFKQKLVIVGKDGWGDVRVSDIVKKLGIDNRVIVTGFVTDVELLSLYQYCDILAMPSIYEGFGLPAIEALSLEKKVVVSKYNAIAEIKGENVYVTELDSESIAQTLESALCSAPKDLADVGADWSDVGQQTFKVLTT